MFNQYLDRLKKFVTVEIVSNRQTTETVTSSKTKTTTTTPANTENPTPLSKETETVATEEPNTSTISSISLTSANEKLL